MAPLSACECRLATCRTSLYIMQVQMLLQSPSRGLHCPTCPHRLPLVGRSPAFQCHKVASHRVQHLHQVKAAAAEADIETTASSVEDEAVSVEDLKTGVAHVYGVRGSPEKFRRVIDKIRGRSYADALYNLTKLPYRAVEEITEVLKSAANNAANNQGASKSDLVVSECFVDVAGKYKRFQPRAKGRPGPIQIKKSHLTVKVTEVPQQARQQLIRGLKKKR